MAAASPSAPFGAPSPRGEGFVRPYCFSTHACIRSDDMRIAVLSYRSLPHWGRGTAPAVDRVLSLIVDLRCISPLIFHTAIPIQPPPLRGTSFHRKEGVSTQAPSLGRGCRAQRGGVGFLFLAALGCYRQTHTCATRPAGEGNGYTRNVIKASDASIF